MSETLRYQAIPDEMANMVRRFLHDAFKCYLRKFPISKGKERMLKRFWRPMSFGQYQRWGRLTQYPLDVQMDFDLTKFIQRHLYFYGGYELPSTHYWLKCAAQAATIFDIGANVGLYSLLAAIENPRATVHAFEPTPELVSALKSNLALNRIWNVVVNEEAIGRTNGQAYLQRCSGDDGSNEGMNFIAATYDPVATISPVEVVALDDYCSQRQIDWVDLMKIDVEGGEYDALVGAENLLRRRAITCIVIEFMDWAAERAGHKVPEIRMLLVDHGYSLFTFGRDRLLPLDENTPSPNSNVIALARPAD